MSANFDTGAQFGLQPIGTTNLTEASPNQDTERRAFPGLATKGSVFSWVNPQISLMGRTGVAGSSSGVTDTVNIRNNTATGGTSTDVPTWAAGAVVIFSSVVATMGTATFQTFEVDAIGLNTGARLYFKVYGAASVGGFPELVTFVVPFFDEPIFSVTYITSNSTGTGTYGASLIGFVRNV